MTVSGTAADTGGGVVGGVEVSTDGGAKWHPATGTTNWSYTWIVHGTRSATLMSRAIDDSGNVETPSGGTAVNVNCPCSLWGPTATPAVVDVGDPGSLEVGVKFTSDTFGTVSGVRFYKAAANTGTHIGNLWTSSGQLLATATFTSESASGWQQVTFPNPVRHLANTTYVASYFAPRGHYSATDNFFYNRAAVAERVDLARQPATPCVATDPDARRTASTTTAPRARFPSSADIGTNYWVDVVYSPSSAPGQVTDVAATAGYTSATVTWNAPSTGGAVTTYTVTPVRRVDGPNAGDRVRHLRQPTGKTVTGLTNGTTYTFRVTASNPVWVRARCRHRRTRSHRRRPRRS